MTALAENLSIEQALKELDGDLKRMSRVFASKIKTMSFDDFYSEALFVFFRAYAKYDPEKGSLLSFISVCVHNRFKDLIQKQKRAERCGVAWSYIADTSETNTPEIEDGSSYYLHSESRYSELLKSPEISKEARDFLHLLLCPPDYLIQESLRKYGDVRRRFLFKKIQEKKPNSKELLAEIKEAL